MKKLFSKYTICIISALSLLIFSSCSKEEPKKDPGKLAGLPAWVLDPKVEDGIGGVGIAQPSRGGIRFQIPKAEMDARANIASTIQTEVNRVTKNALRESNTNGINDVEDFFSQATKNVVKNLPLSGIERINIYQAQDGTLYVHMRLAEKDFSKYIKNSQKTLSKSLEEANIARENIGKAQEAAKELFDDLETEREI